MMTPNSIVCRLLLISILLLAYAPTPAQDTLLISAQNIAKGKELSLADAHWYFHAGDPGPQAKGQVSTMRWDSLHSTAFGKTNPPQAWNGIGWFGLWIKVEKELVGRKLGLRINHDGASELFIDGHPLGGFGKVGLSAAEMKEARAPREVTPVWLTDTLPHLLTVRYSNFFGVYPNFTGFTMSIADYEQLQPKMVRNKLFYSFLLICAAVNMMLALLHLFLFFFYPRQRLNVYFSLIVGTIAGICISVYFYYEASLPIVQFYAEFLSAEFKVLLLWSGGLLLYTLGYKKVPRLRLTVLTLVAGLYLLKYAVQFLIDPKFIREDYFSIVLLLFILDAFRGLWPNLKQKERGTWLITTGMAAMILLYLFVWADIAHIWSQEQSSVRILVLAIGILVFPICLSLYLASDFAGTNRHLSAKLEEVKALSEKALRQEEEKTEMLQTEARRLEEIVKERTAEIQQQADKLKEMDIVKSRFFTNITHELKTPLTLIINPARELLLVNDPKAVQNALLIVKHGNRLLQLINQLLDLSKLENGIMQVSASPLEMVGLLNQQINNFSSVCAQKGLYLKLHSDYDELWVAGDQDKLEKIISNILSNAVKFTSNGGITMSLQNSVSGHGYRISVQDTGKGIPAAALPYIFERFYQADQYDNRANEGTGIGLALTRELVEFLDGTISVKSSTGEGTIVVTELPLQPAEPRFGDSGISSLHSIAEQAHALELSPMGVHTDDGPVVLIIEDHQDLREFISRLLIGKYRALTATNGKEGLAAAREHIPDLVITDLMMPEMDGYEFCKNLKADELTSHIPVIMLTAKTDANSRIQGLEEGADAYLPKPFLEQELFAIMHNLTVGRQKLRERYLRAAKQPDTGLPLPSIEKRFLDEVRTTILKNLDDPLFGADQLAGKVNLSRTQLHRKLKAVLGQSPGELIRMIRLEHARHLLQEKAVTVSEAAYAAGFSNPASFSTSFSRYFGYSPSQANQHAPRQGK